jgi:hypothetical protein
MTPTSTDEPDLATSTSEPDLVLATQCHKDVARRVSGGRRRR